MKELTIEELTTEAMQLLPLGVDELYMILGCQLLASEKPKRVAGIISYLSAARKARQAQGPVRYVAFEARQVRLGRRC